MSLVLPGCVCSSDFVQDFHLQSHLGPQCPRGFCLSANALVESELKLRKPLCPCRSSRIAPRISLSFKRVRGPKVPPAEPFPSQPGPCLCSVSCRILRLGAPRSTEEDPPQKYNQKYQVLANSFVANEAEGQPCPKKAFAEGQAVSGEVSLLYLFPFLRTTT